MPLNFDVDSWEYQYSQVNKLMDHWTNPSRVLRWGTNNQVQTKLVRTYYAKTQLIITLWPGIIKVNACFEISKFNCNIP